MNKKKFKSIISFLLCVSICVSTFFNVSNASQILNRTENRAQTENKHNIEKFNYIIIGNSVTMHGINDHWPSKRGMAATRDNKDYVRVLKQLFYDDGIPTVTCKVEQYPFQKYEDMIMYEEKILPTIPLSGVDMVILQIGENILTDAPVSNYKTVIKNMVQKIQSTNPNTKVLLMDTMYPIPEATDALMSIANETSSYFVPIDKIKDDKSYRSFIGDVVYDEEGIAYTVKDEAVAIHPNDKGHEYIAKQIFNTCVEKIFPFKGIMDIGNRVTIVDSFKRQDYLDVVETFGDTSRLQNFVKRARNGESLTIVGFGGSVTAGAGLVVEYDKRPFGQIFTDNLQKMFPLAKFKFVDAGLSGTNVRFSVFRVRDDVLKYNPDLVILDFSVNNNGDTDLKNLFESIISQINKAREDTAIINIQFTEMHENDSDSTMLQENSYLSPQRRIILKAAQDFEIPSISFHNFVWSKINNNVFSKNDVLLDHVHPTHFGHVLAANMLTALMQHVNDLPEVQNIKPMKKLTVDKYANYDYITFDPNPFNTSKTRGSLFFKKRYEDGLVAYKGWESIPADSGLLDFDLASHKSIAIGFQFFDAGGESITFAKKDANGEIREIAKEISPEVGLFTTVIYENVGNYLGILSSIKKGHVEIYGIGVLK